MDCAPASIPLEIVVATLELPPERLEVPNWSSRSLAKELGCSNATVIILRQDYGLQPWRAETFKSSADPVLEAKVRDTWGPTCTRWRTRWWCAATRSSRFRR